MKKKLLTICISMALIFTLAACGKVVDETTAKHYRSQAEVAIVLFAEKNYEALVDRFDSQMKAALPAEKLTELAPIIDQAGEYIEVKKSTVETQDGYYITVLIAKFTNKNLVFTISYNSNDEIAGLYIK